MRAELPAISFLCLAFLVVFIPIRRVRCSVVNLAIVSWLVGCNLVHGINALVWSGNVDIRVPIWCDLVTKLLLAAIVAISGAFLCISHRLELLSSSRPISVDPRTQRNRLLMEFIFCYVNPIIYMALHFIVQDHRFDLVKDIGCSASIHPSSPGLILMWFPPLILCGISFYFCVRAINNSAVMSYDRFSDHIESRTTMTSSFFVRRLATSYIITVALSVVCVFSALAPSTLEPWTSWSDVHAEFSIINILTSPDEIESVELTWWGIPAVSILYILLAFTIGEETRDALKWIRQAGSRLEKPRPNIPMILPTYTMTKQETPEIASRFPSLGTPRPRPQTLELRSGWDDMLDAKKGKWWSPGRKSQPSTTASDSPCPSPTSTSEDQTFIAATLDYLVSPTAKTLGLPGSTPTILLSPPSVYSTPGKAAYEIPPRPTIPPPTVESYKLHSPSQGVPEDTKSTISSIFDASWPQPPPSPISIALSRNISPSRSTSPASFNLNIGDALYHAIDPERGQTRPFHDSYVSSLQEVPTAPELITKKPLTKRPSVQRLRRTLSSEKYGLSGSAPGDVIYMTVVKETT